MKIFEVGSHFDLNEYHSLPQLHASIFFSQRTKTKKYNLHVKFL